MATINLTVPFTAQLHTQPFTGPSIPNNPISSRFRKPARSLKLKCMATSITSKPIAEPTTSPICDRWRKIHGEDNWAGMIDPMDPLLRTEVIRYAEFSQACYDGFDNDPFSKFCGSCKYPPKSFFHDLGLDNWGYEITSYIYSSNTSELIPKVFTKAIRSDGPWNPKVNWMGYVAVSKDERAAKLGRRDIVVAWRGTVTKLEWVSDLISFLKPVTAENLSSPDPAIKVLGELKRLIKVYKEKGEEISITLTGHSLGSAVATLCAYDIAESNLDKLDNNRKIHVSVFSFSGPRLGNTKFKKRLEALGVKVLRTFNVNDKVPTVPGILFNEQILTWIQPIVDFIIGLYTHVGVTFSLDNKSSPFVKDNISLASMHNLQLLMHLVDGYQSTGARFSPAVGRDKALLNRDDDILEDKYLIPPNWGQIENKGLLKNENGEWELPEQEDRFTPEGIERHLEKLSLD
ncbi:Lipase, class 3 [Cynara cardunculus var. scolymus]|uniref:Lipase, class 3 n=1 Tax=Cynara cardunculus var. scolymus TaxID=59895 RepID=A0A103Y3K7_CYNCS|nr:Lipase, class 3 [Cynara cardunculus var. scolymus]